MFKTTPFVSEKVWGYERWIVSTHAAGQSHADDATEFIGGKELSRIVGPDYPLLIKLIQADDTLSVQVHPDDKYAREKEDTYGKTECWYVLDAAEGATLICGLNKEYSSQEIHKAIKENTLEALLREIPVKKGDFIFIPAGTVHAIQGGLRLLEVQQPSDITYRLYDWGRPREIHVEKGVEVIKNIRTEAQNPFSGHFSCEYFTLERQTISNTGKIEFSIHAENPTPALETKWLSFFVIEGEGTCTSNTGESFTVSKEDTVMVRLEEKITVEGTMTIMKMY